jgi:glycosyltransferase involved in cell wall biosynthesis
MSYNRQRVYRGLIPRVREVVQRALPPDATTIVVSKGDSEMLKLDGRRAWHFPQREDGVYAGYYPSDSAAAIAHLEALRAKGGEFLVFPQSAFWWLEHYVEFRQHLESQYRVLLREEDTCLIFQLREAETCAEQSANQSTSIAYQPEARQQQPAAQSEPLVYQPFIHEFEETEKSLKDYVDEHLVDDLKILFDVDYYNEQAGTDFSSVDAALIEYLEQGWRQGYNPHILFDTNYYLEQYPAVKVSGANPLVHFLLHSVSGGQNPSPYFDTEFYYNQALDLRQAGVNALVHYLTHADYGNAPHPNPLFSNGYYLKTYLDVKDAGVNPLIHYLKFGFEEGRWGSYTHANIIATLLGSSRHALLRGSWKNGTVLLFSYNTSCAEAPIIPKIARVLARDYRLRCLAVIYKRQEVAPELENHANVVVLGDFQLACDIFSPSALRMLVKSLCSLKPLFSVCTVQKMLETLKANGIPSCYLCPDFADQYPKKILEKLFQQVDRVIFTSSATFHSIVKKIGFYPSNVAIRPYGLFIPALSETSREQARENLIRNLGWNKEPFIVLGYGEGFDLFLAVAKMLRKRRPDMDIAFVWVVRERTERLPLPYKFSYGDEIEKSGLGDVVFHIDERIAIEEYFSAADTVFLSSREGPFPGFVSQVTAARVPVICFEGSTNGTDTIGNSSLIVPYLDVEAVCEKICTLFDNVACKEQITVHEINSGFSIENYVGSLLELAKRDLHLPEVIWHPEDKRAAKTPRKVIIPCSDWRLSGVNSTLEVIGKELIRLGWDVQIVFTRDQEEIIESAGSDTHLPQIPYRYLQPERPGIEGMWEALISYLESNAPCIMFMAYDFEANSIAPALTDKVGVVAWVQADDGDYYEQTYRLGRYCNAVVCVSECIKQGVAELNPLIGDRSQVIHNSSVWEHQTAGKKPAPSEKLRLIYTGRLVQYQKRILDFIELAQSLDRMGIPYQVTLIGEFSAHENTRALFEIKASAHLEDGRIILPGRMAREQILEELSNHDLFVLLSDFEGLPLSLLEAMAHGCVPIVAEMESGIPEVIANGQNGFIVSGRDYDEWAALFVDLWRNPKRFSQISQKARKTVREQFTVEQVRKQFDKLFRRIAEEICSEAYKRPPSLNWGAHRSPTGDVLPPPSMYRPPIGKLRGIP